MGESLRRFLGLVGSMSLTVSLTKVVLRALGTLRMLEVLALDKKRFQI